MNQLNFGGTKLSIKAFLEDQTIANLHQQMELDSS